MEEDLWKAYYKPALNRRYLRQAMQALLGQARDFLPFLRPEPRQTVREGVPRVYQKPRLRKLTPEQASLLLIGYASVGHQGAIDLIAHLSYETPGPMNPRLR